jgi:hypothetical protein
MCDTELDLMVGRTWLEEAEHIRHIAVLPQVWLKLKHASKTVETRSKDTR